MLSKRDFLRGFLQLDIHLPLPPNPNWLDSSGIYFLGFMLVI